MPALFDIKGHLVFYRKYHLNPKNVAIHLVCIPLILLSALAFSINTQLLGDNHPYVTLGSVVAWCYGLFYSALDWQLGLPSFAVLATYAHLARKYYLSLGPSSLVTTTQFMQFAVGTHVVCWLAQFYGHAFHEKRSPALVDNLLQALVLAPFFVVYEAAFSMGYKLDIKKYMDLNAVRLNREDAKKKAI